MKKQIFKIISIFIIFIIMFNLIGCKKKKHQHDLKYYEKTEATCENDGNIEYWKCTTCNKYFSDANGKKEISDVTIKKLGHQYIEIAYSNLEHTKECKNCHTIVDKEKHILDENGKCSVCDYQDILEYELLEDNTYEVSDIANRDGVSSHPNIVITKVVIPKYYNDILVTSIEGWAFEGCTSLQNITIPSSVTSIGHYAFYSCTSLESITIPSSVTSIGESAFEYCTSLQNITIPSSVTSIENRAFYGCTNLSEVTIEEGVITIGESAFIRCYKLQSITIPESVTSIGHYAFYSCTSLESITIPSSVTSIGSYAFSGCTNLSEVTIEEGVITIGESAFKGCTSLQNITIPSSVTSIGNGAFSGCINLESIIVDPNNSVYDSRDNCNAIIETSTNTLIAGCKNTIIPSSVTSIGNGAFSGCTNLSEVIIEEGVITIGESAFIGCTSLESITIPSSVKSIGSSAFSGCTSLESITIPSSVTSIGSYAFYRCTNLSEVIFEDPNNWTVKGNILSSNDLNNPELAASYLTDKYWDYTWTKKQE